MYNPIKDFRFGNCGRNKNNSTSCPSEGLVTPCKTRKLVFAGECLIMIALRMVRRMRTAIMAEVIVKLPDTLARIFGETPEARSRRVTEDAAIEEYRAGRLSQRQVGEMLNLD